MTIRDLNDALDMDEKKTIKGGTDLAIAGTTDVPIYCSP